MCFRTLTTAIPTTYQKIFNSKEAYTGQTDKYSEYQHH